MLRLLKKKSKCVDISLYVVCTFKACFIKPQTQNTFCTHIENDVWNNWSILKGWNFIIKGIQIFIIQIFKFQNMCLKMHESSNINNNTLVGLFNFEKMYSTQQQK